MSTSISVTDINKILRKQLNAAYPGVTFYVRKDHASCINISWTDGPLAADVKEITWWAVGQTFDGMTDTRDYTAPRTAVQHAPSLIVAEELAKISGGLDEPVWLLSAFVSTHRDASEASLLGAAAALQHQGYTVKFDEDGNVSPDRDTAASDAAEQQGISDAFLVNSWSRLARIMVADVDYTAEPAAQ